MITNLIRLSLSNRVLVVLAFAVAKNWPACQEIPEFLFHVRRRLTSAAKVYGEHSAASFEQRSEDAFLLDERTLSSVIQVDYHWSVGAFFH